MTNLDLDINIDDFDDLIPVGPNTYDFMVRFFELGTETPLGNPFIPNQWSDVVTTTIPNFKFPVPIADDNYEINATVKIYANNRDTDCCIKTQNITFINIKNPTFQVTSTHPTCTGTGTEINPGSVTFENIQHATRYKICYDVSAFDCPNCTVSSGTINPGVPNTIEITPAPAGQARAFVIRLYNGPLCSAYADYHGNHISPQCDNGGEPPVVISPQAVLLNSLTTDELYSYEPATGTVANIGVTHRAPDIGHTANKTFVYEIIYNSPEDYFLRIFEFNITLNPFTISASPAATYDIDQSYYGAGLHVESNTKMYICSTKVTQITITGSVATPTDLFNLPEYTRCTGDLIYDPATQLFALTYHRTLGAQQPRIGIFRRNGVLVRSAPAPVNNIYGIFQYEGITYAVSGYGALYTLNLNTLAFTAIGAMGIVIAGASQIQSNISIPS